MSDMTPAIKAAIERLAQKENCSTEFAVLNGITAYKRDADALALILADHARLRADNARLTAICSALSKGPIDNPPMSGRSPAALTPPATGERG